MPDILRITYYVADGYVGRDRPQHAKVTADDFDGCETDADIVERLEQIVDDHFRENVYSEISDDTEDLVQRVRDLMAASALPA